MPSSFFTWIRITLSGHPAEGGPLFRNKRRRDASIPSCWIKKKKKMFRPSRKEIIGFFRNRDWRASQSKNRQRPCAPNGGRGGERGRRGSENAGGCFHSAENTHSCLKNTTWEKKTTSKSTIRVVGKIDATTGFSRARSRFLKCSKTLDERGEGTIKRSSSVYLTPLSGRSRRRTSSLTSRIPTSPAPSLAVFSSLSPTFSPSYSHPRCRLETRERAIGLAEGTGTGTGTGTQVQGRGRLRQVRTYRRGKEHRLLCQGQRDKGSRARTVVQTARQRRWRTKNDRRGVLTYQSHYGG